MNLNVFDDYKKQIFNRQRRLKNVNYVGEVVVVAIGFHKDMALHHPVHVPTHVHLEVP